jgi:hypothetical protein|tara:strand:- start:256 stop:423 length:168 start_codon:yes stop_codon:yes gene_type:complete
MAKYHVDRDPEYMYKMWGTTSLITDYWCKPHPTTDNAEEFSEAEIDAMGDEKEKG